MGCFQSKKNLSKIGPQKGLWVVSDTPNQSDTVFSDIHCHYSLGKTLSSVVGQTRLATVRESGENCVVKTISKGASVCYERVQALKELDCPHVARLLDFLGGGTAGLVCAMGAVGLGARVALVERHLLG